ncbi:hypothetical protein [Streptomyces sp. NPDC102347]|uniref:hypothetical protein n=2 Tax=unclassified Streptomyces TaxID=2593676 RepID=UPI0037F708B0
MSRTNSPRPRALSGSSRRDASMCTSAPDESGVCGGGEQGGVPAQALADQDGPSRQDLLTTTVSLTFGMARARLSPARLTP